MDNRTLVRTVLFAMAVSTSAASMAQGVGAGMTPGVPGPTVPMPGVAPGAPGTVTPPVSNPSATTMQGPNIGGQTTNGAAIQGGINTQGTTQGFVGSPNPGGANCACPPQVVPNTRSPIGACAC